MDRTAFVGQPSRLPGGWVSVALAIFVSMSCQLGRSDRPNILWIVSEDNGPFLGCYGDEQATTPNLDRLASQGVLYKNAFANAPVCAPARSTIITGMYASALGTLHMRSINPLPEGVRFFTEHLRDAGYYCTNHFKEDYNTARPKGAWDDSSKWASWTHRAPGQPFFAVVNLKESHESSLHETVATKHDPDEVVLPPYHPDTPEIRHDWAQYYDQITAMDGRVGEVLADLEKQGLTEETIVFYYADHGGVLTRSKRFVYDSGTHVPLIIRFPEKYRHLAPGDPGTRSDRLIAFVDLAPTVLSLAGVRVPSSMQGRAFLGKQQDAPSDYVHLVRGRMDERYDMMRAVRTKRFKYIRNYFPHRAYGQHLETLWKMPATRAWEAAFRDDEADEIQQIFWKPKPTEELYDIVSDPHEVDNLADDPDYADVLSELREANRRWLLDVLDPTFLPEGEMIIRSKAGSPYDLVRSDSFDFEALLVTAEAAGERDQSNLDAFETLLDNDDSGVRYWAVQGLIGLGEGAWSATDTLLQSLNDPSPDVRIAAAEALARLGLLDQALPVLEEGMGHENLYVRLHAINVVDGLDGEAAPLRKLLEGAAANQDDSKYIRRVARKALSDLETLARPAIGN